MLGGYGATKRLENPARVSSYTRVRSESMEKTIIPLAEISDAVLAE